MVRDLPRPELLLVGRDLDEPGEEGAVFDEGRPLGGIPDDVLAGLHGGAGLSAEEDDDGIGFGGDEAEEEDVLGAAVVALGRGLAEWRLGVKADFFVLGANEVVDDVGARGGAAGVAEPL